MAKKTFEQSLQQLEKIVEELESGELPLEKALQKFEEGVNLSKACSTTLDQIEQKVNVLLKTEDGSTIEQPFEADTAADS